MKLYHRHKIRSIFNKGTGTIVEYPKTTTTAAHVLLAANADSVDRPALFIVKVTETFANGTGAQPTFKIGQTGTAEKFLASASLTGAVIGTELVIVGTLTHADDLLVTATVATGTATGAITVTAQLFPATL